MKKILLIVSISLTISCSNRGENEMDSERYYSEVEDLTKDHTLRKIKAIKLRSVNMDSTINSSFVGNLWKNENELYFSDSYFNYVFNIDINGNLLNTYLGKGEGPKEIDDLDDIVANKDGSYTVLSSYTSSIYNYNNNWERVNKSNIDFNMKRSYQETYENPEPSLPESYELETGYEDILKNWDENLVAMAVSASHPKFNGYFDSDLFYNYSRVLALINKKTGVIEEFIGRRPPVYLKYQNLPNFNHFKFEVDDDNLFLSFMPDSNIYVIDKKSKLATGKFGQPGIDMDTNYRLTDNYEEAQNNELLDLETFGYYTHLKIVPENDLIFRSYTKGKQSKVDGLQIYDHYQLVGDLEVPKGFKMIGKVNNTFIGTLNLESGSDQVTFYKITFEYED